MTAIWPVKKVMANCLLFGSTCNRCRSGAATALGEVLGKAEDEKPSREVLTRVRNSEIVKIRLSEVNYTFAIVFEYIQDTLSQCQCLFGDVRKASLRVNPSGALPSNQSRRDRHTALPHSRGPSGTSTVRSLFKPHQ